MTESMQNNLATYPIPAVIAVVIHEDNVLLVRRGQEPNKGRWGFPGGKIEIGETIKEAAIRELEEETSIYAKADSTLTIFDVLDRDEEGKIRYHYVLIAVLCQWLRGAPIAASDAAEARWFPIDKLDEKDPDLIERVLSISKEAQRKIHRQSINH